MIRHLPFQLVDFFRDIPSLREKVVFFWEKSSHFFQVIGKIIFFSKFMGAREMVDALIGFKPFNEFLSHIGISPEDIGISF